MMVPPGFDHGRIGTLIAFHLHGFVRSRRVGTVLVEIGFVLARSPDTVRAPDVAFVRAERVEDPIPGYFEGAPDLAVEVLSPDDRPGYVRDRVAEWLEAGAGTVWVVDPRSRTIAVHRPRAKPKVLGEADTLRGDDALKGFEVAVREIFAA